MNGNVTPGARLVLSAALVLLLAPAAPGRAAVPPTPTGEVRTAVTRVLEILKRADLAAKGKEPERRALLRKEIEPVFDFGEMAKRSLGPAWRDRTEGERREFVAVFSGFLERSYIGKVESYRGEKIRFDREEAQGDRGAVRSVIETRDGREVEVEYRLLLEDGRWRIYDVVIEGVGLVGNYRAQFAGMLSRMSFGEMMRKLKGSAAEGGSG